VREGLRQTCHSAAGQQRGGGQTTQSRRSAWVPDMNPAASARAAGRRSGGPDGSPQVQISS
jgi:hypothetical protein